MKKQIAVIVGSQRRGSFSRKIAQALINLLPETFAANIVEIGHLPLFDQDYDDDGATPEAWVEFRKSIAKADAFLFVTPEYNRSYTALIKNALDIASRPYGQNVWSGKPGAAISVSIGKIGGFGANRHLQQVLSFLNIYVMPQPEAYIGNAAELFDADNHIVDPSASHFLQMIAEAFATWVEKLSASSSDK